MQEPLRALLALSSLKTATSQKSTVIGFVIFWQFSQQTSTWHADLLEARSPLVAVPAQIYPSRTRVTLGIYETCLWLRIELAGLIGELPPLPQMMNSKLADPRPPASPSGCVASSDCFCCSCSALASTHTHTSHKLINQDLIFRCYVGRQQ